MGYHVWRSMAFKANDQSYGHIHGIVCSNDLILCTRVHLAIPNNVDKGSFHFLCTENSFSIFRVPELSSFCEGPPIYLLQNWTKSFFYNTRLYLMHNWQNGWVPKVLIHLSWKRQIPADSIGSGSNLNCSYLVVCSLFFPKIISRYISICLIRETRKIPRLNHKVGTVLPAVLTAFWNGHKIFKKMKKLENLRIVSSYVAKLPAKIINL